MDPCGSGKGIVAGSCEEVNEPSVSVKDKEFLTSWATVRFSRKTAA
jgi:hypothetical protein